MSNETFNIKPTDNATIKGQIKPKADWHAIDSPKKRMNEFGFFAMTVRKYLKQIGSFGFLENLRHANLLTVLSDI